MAQQPLAKPGAANQVPVTMLGQAKKSSMARMYQTTAKLSGTDKASAMNGTNYSNTPGNAGVGVSNTSIRKLSGQQRTR